MSEPITVKQLRAMLQGVPDDLPCFTYDSESEDYLAVTGAGARGLVVSEDRLDAVELWVDKNEPPTNCLCVEHVPQKWYRDE